MALSCTKRLWSAIAAAFLIVVAASLPLSDSALAQSTKLSKDAYRLSPGDTLTVGVLEDPNLDREVLVLPDGRISLPLAGTIVAGGRTPRELEGIVRSRLRTNFVDPPTVTVTVSEIGEESDTLEVFVLGEVGSPGRYEYDPETPITVLKALSLAGGVGPFAARRRIQIRQLEGEIETMRIFDYDAAEEGMINTSRDLAALADGAVIIVPERGLFE